MSSTQQLLLGEGAGGAAPVYIEDVFSTYLYTGNSLGQTITNGIDLSTKGGLVWMKERTASPAGTGNSHNFVDTARGVGKLINSNTTAAQQTYSTVYELSAFNNNGFTLALDGGLGMNENTVPTVSWTFREQPKFFDIVTYTGTGSNTTIAHNLGSVPGCIIVKRTDASANWAVYHRSLGNTKYINLNLTALASTSATRWNNTTPTSSVFSIGTDATVNASGGTYVAYIFAHDAGGFGLTGLDNVISCGSFTTDGSGQFAQVNLGYEPQFVLIKNSDGGPANWKMFDNMRGLTVSTSNATLFPNLNTVETAESNIQINATGFISAATNSLEVGANFIYIAIRRGPMKVPTVGTSVFGLSARTGTGANATVTGGQTDDAVLIKNRGSAVNDAFASRLTNTGYLVTSATTAEVAAGATILQANPWDVMNGVKVGTTSTITNASANTYINYLFKRAPSFMDVVCYTGTGVARTVTHNLTVMPELIIVKMRSTGQNWIVGTQFGATKYTAIYLNSSAASIYPPQTADYTSATGSNFNAGFGAQPTASTFTTDATTLTNSSGNTYISYLFATCAGVSKVGSYTGTATTLQIDCGFTAGARFVMIKRTDSTGDWYVWDTARGIVSGNDPYWLLNSTAAEVTSTDYIDTYSAGFEISSTAPAAINASGGTYIFLAIA
jgi:hypothetical protein